MAKPAIENKNSIGLPAILFAGWAVALLVAFLSCRGSDVGQLRNLIGNLGGGPLFGDDAFASLVGVAVSAFILQALLGTGKLVYSLLRIEMTSTALTIALMASIGAAIWSLIWFLLGLAGAYYLPVAIAAIVLGHIPLALRFGPAKEAPRDFKFWSELSGIEWLIFALIAFVLLISLTASLAPPTAKDTLLYHFALPKAFIAQHSNAFVEGNIASYLALGTEMHNVWAMLLGGIISPRAAVEEAAGATSFMFFPLLLAAIYGWARELKIERRWCLLAVLIVASVPTAYHVAASAYIDLALALYVTLAIYSLGRWWRTQENRWLVLIAVFLGAALSIKLTALFVFAAFALVILLRSRAAKDSSGNAGKIFAGGFAALILASVIASPWYLRNWKATGSPVFPFYMSIWKGEAVGWDIERSNLFQAMNSQYGGLAKTPVDYLLAPWNLSVVAQPEQAEYFDGVLGIGFLFGLPILIWGLWKFDVPVEIKIGVGIAGIMFLFWLFSSQQLRYLLPILPVIAIAIVLAAEAVAKNVEGFRSIAQGSLTVAAVAGILTGAAWFLQKAPLRVVLGGETRDQYLTRNLDYYPYYQWLNTETSADAKVWLINMRRDTYNLDRPVFSDYLFEDWTLRKMVWESRNALELKARTAAMGVQYVLTRHDFLFDYDRSTIVDDKKPRSENEAKLKIVKEFILDPSRTIRSDDRFSLIKVF